jgi:hypothetical protein
MTTSDLFLISPNMGTFGPILFCKKKKVLCIFGTSTFIVTKMRKLAPHKKDKVLSNLFFFPFSFEENHRLTHLEMNLEIYKSCV